MSSYLDFDWLISILPDVHSTGLNLLISILPKVDLTGLNVLISILPKVHLTGLNVLLFIVGIMFLAICLWRLISRRK